MNRATLADHLRIDRYGDFLLTDAIRPAPGTGVVPRQGFRFDTFRDPPARREVPVLAAAVSRERLFDVFLALLRPLGTTVDVVLETSHGMGPAHRDLWRTAIDRPVLESHLCEFEELLLNDGCAGVAVMSRQAAQEVQLDEHKLLLVYAHDLERFESVLRQARVERDDCLRLITEGEHLHATDPRHLARFEQLCARLGVGERAEPVSG